MTQAGRGKGQWGGQAALSQIRIGWVGCGGGDMEPALGPFLQSLEEGIVAAAAAAAATLLTMTTCADAIAREKDRASYRALFR
jgi:hypothetical protein